MIPIAKLTGIAPAMSSITTKTLCKEISLHQNYWQQFLKVWQQWTLAYNGQFLSQAFFVVDGIYCKLRFSRFRQKEKRITCFITARNSSCGKVMFLQVSVCPQGGVYPSMQWGRGVYPRMQLGRRGCVTRWVYIPSTVNKRAVCILLECFLVTHLQIPKEI